MKKVGAYEAKTHLPKLLEEVSKGKEILITKHGVSMAGLRPSSKKFKFASKDLVAKIKAFRKGKKLEGLDFKRIIEQWRD